MLVCLCSWIESLRPLPLHPPSYILTHTHCHRLTFPEERPPQKRKHPESGEGGEGGERRTLVVEPYTIPNRGPYPYNQPKRSVDQ